MLRRILNANEKISAFSLAEVIVVVILLGIVAMLIIPTSVRRATERENKTRLRKAMAAYNTLLDKMVIENTLPRNMNTIDNWANNDGNCSNARAYIKGDPSNSCIFRSPDGLWYNITNISQTIVGFRNRNNATSLNNALDENNNNTFLFVTSIDNNGSVRVNDTIHESTNSNVAVNRQNLRAIRKVSCFLDRNQCVANENQVCSCSAEGCCGNSCRNQVCRESVKGVCNNIYKNRCTYNYFGNVCYTGGNTCQRNRYYDSEGNPIGVVEQYDNGNGMYNSASTGENGERIMPSLDNTYPTFYKVTKEGNDEYITFAVNCGGYSVCDAKFNKQGEMVAIHTPYMGDCHKGQTCSQYKNNPLEVCKVTGCTYNKATGEWTQDNESSPYRQMLENILDDWMNDKGGLYTPEE